MRNLFFLVLMLFFMNIKSQDLKQQQPKRNSIYFEAFGQGFYNSFAFDRLYRTEKKIKTSLTAGITLIPSKELFVVALPLSYNFLFGKKSNHLELGIGLTAMFFKSGNINVSQGYTDVNGIQVNETFIGHQTDFYSYSTAKIGYRFQKKEGGFFFRCTIMQQFAGINKEGEIKGGTGNFNYKQNFEYFKSLGLTGLKMFPWAGISFGYTLKK